MHDDHRVLEFLLNNGAKVDIADNEKRTPLMWGKMRLKSPRNWLN
jgi:hypothetical protein